MNLIKQLTPYRKAVVTFLVGVLQVVALYFTLADDGVLSGADKNALIGSIIIGITGTGAVYQTKNGETK